MMEFVDIEVLSESEEFYDETAIMTTVPKQMVIPRISILVTLSPRRKKAKIEAQNGKVW